MFGRTALAEVEELHLAPFDARNVHDRVALSAAVAQHQARTSPTPVSVKRPSSSNNAPSARDANDRLWVTTTIAIPSPRASSTKKACSRSLSPCARFRGGSSAAGTGGAI